MFSITTDLLITLSWPHLYETGNYLLLLLTFYISGMDPKEAKAHIYTTSCNYLNVTQYLTQVACVPKLFKLGANFSPSCALHVRAHTAVSALVDTAAWTSTSKCLQMWGVNTVLGSGNSEPPLRSVHQLHIRQWKCLKHCSKVVTSPACHPPLQQIQQEFLYQCTNESAISKVNMENYH